MNKKYLVIFLGILMLIFSEKSFASDSIEEDKSIYKSFKDKGYNLYLYYSHDNLGNTFGGQLKSGTTLTYKFCLLSLDYTLFITDYDLLSTTVLGIGVRI